MTIYVSLLHNVILLILASILTVGWGTVAHAQETPADDQYGSPTDRGSEYGPVDRATEDQGDPAGEAVGDQVDPAGGSESEDKGGPAGGSEGEDEGGPEGESQGSSGGEGESGSGGGPADGPEGGSGGTAAPVEPASGGGAPWGFGIRLLVALAGVFASLYLILRVIPGLSLPLQRRAFSFLALIGLLVAGAQVLLAFADPLSPGEPLQLTSLAAQAAVPACLLVAGLLVRRSEIEEVGPLRRSADQDPLTVLPNQAFFRRAASRRVALASRHGVPLSLAMLDIDDFKEYNDLFGHEAGNAVLVRVAGVLRRSARADDLVARYGGEEFMMLLNSGQEDAEEALERIRAGIEARCSPTDGQMSRQVTVSAGVASLAGEPRTLEELIEAADEAMYHAKRTGKNRVVGANEAA